MSIVDRQRIAAVRKLEERSYAFATEPAPLQAPADTLHALLVERADAPRGFNDDSAEGAELALFQIDGRTAAITESGVASSNDKIEASISIYEKFRAEGAAEIAAQGQDHHMAALSRSWMGRAFTLKYPYHFEWMGRPIIQFPQDIVAVQELIWQVKPDLVIETGIAHGGSLILSASMLALIDLSEAIERGTPIDPKLSKRKVLGLDIDIRAHNRAAISRHPMASRIEMIEGSAIAPEVIAKVRTAAERYKRILVFLDSMHSHAHVLAELEAYAPLVSVGSYCVVFDTVIEDMPADSFPDRPWHKGDNPKTAVRTYLNGHPEFEVDKSIDRKLLITAVTDGFLRRRW